MALHRRRVLRLVSILALMPLLASAAPPPKAATVEIRSFAFHDMDVLIAAGGTVTWKNLDGEPHTVTSTQGAFHSAALDQGDVFSVRFDRPGVYPYVCSIHPQMRAAVTVR
jgi:plastocyanin